MEFRISPLAAIVISLLLIATSGAIAQQPTGADAASQQFAFAYRLFQRNENKLAAEALDEFLGRFPKDERRGDALYYRALVAQRLGDRQSAARILIDAPPTKLVPAHAMLLLRGQLHCELNEFDKALAALEKLDTAKLDPTIQASALFLTGQAYRGAGNATGALKSLQAAAAVDSPLRAKALLEAAKLQLQSSKPNDAIETLTACVAVNDTQVTPEAALLGGDNCYANQLYPRAIEFYKSVIASHQSTPQFGPAVLGTLWSQLSAKQYDAVFKTFETHKDALRPEHKPMAWYLAGSALQEQNKHEAVIQLLQSIPPAPSAQPLPGNPIEKSLLKIASSQFELSQWDAMTKTVEKLKAQFPDSPLNADGQFLMASADANRGDPTSGVNRLTIIIEQGEKHAYLAQAVMHRGRLYESTNKAEAAAADYQKFIEMAIQKKIPDDAKSLTAEAALRFMAISGKLNRDDAVIATADWLLTQPIEPLAEQETLYRKALALIRQQAHGPALSVLTHLLTKHPQNSFLAQARYYRGLLLMQAKKPDEAVSDLQASLAAGGLPEALQANAMRVAAMRLREKNDAASADAAAKTLAQLEKLMGLGKLTHDELLWLAAYHLAHGNPAEAMRCVEPMTDPKAEVPGPARAEAMLLAARARRDQKDAKAAVDLYRQVVALGSGWELQARLEMAKTLRDSGQIDDALSEYAGLIYAQPSAIAAEAILDCALIHHAQAKRKRAASDTEGANKSLEESTKLLKRLVLLFSFPQLSPRAELGYIELSEVAAESGQTEEAGKALTELTEKFKDGPYASYAKAMLSARQNKKADAVFLLKKLREEKLDERLMQRVQTQLKTLESAG